MQANGAAHWANNHNNTWHAKKVKRHTLMRGVAAAGLEEGAVVPSEVVEARLVTQIEAWVEACSKRALLASLLLGLMVRDSFTRVTVLADGLYELLEEIPAADADIPDFAERNLFLQLGRGLPPPGIHSQPSAAVEDVLIAYPDLHAELDAIPRYPHDCNTVDDVGQKLETSFANSLTELFKRRVGQAVALAGARVIAGSHEHQRRFGLPLDGSPAWTERQRSWVVRSVRGKEVTWLEGQGGVVPTEAMRYEVARQRRLLGVGQGVVVNKAWRQMRVNHEFRTSRVSSAHTDVVPGQQESFRWLRPVRSMATRSRIRGLMCSTSNGIRFYDRDVSAALNIRRIAAGPGRPRELSSWVGRPAMPNPGRPGQEWVCVRDRGLLRKWQRRHQRQR
ncbi:hypothetical protein QJQ45_010375 [Haematococcus lacustris]|nr:hypothetical protein QJQ45_010375 [Haematococcus lacustris]